MALDEGVIQAYESLRANTPLFPHKLCKIAALIMHSKGYEIVQGKVKLDNYCCSGIHCEILHYWNYDPRSGLYFDITASQFNHHFHGKPLPDIPAWEEDNAPPIYKLCKRNISPYEVI
jgi:hypothetical protein